MVLNMIFLFKKYDINIRYNVVRNFNREMYNKESVKVPQNCIPYLFRACSHLRRCFDFLFFVFWETTKESKELNVLFKRVFQTIKIDFESQNACFGIILKMTKWFK